MLDLGCGTGRVALDLASRGHEVTGLDADADLVRALEERAREREPARARPWWPTPGPSSCRSAFALAIAPMQVVQLLGGPAGRRAMLARVAGPPRARRRAGRGAGRPVRLGAARARPSLPCPTCWRSTAGCCPPPRSTCATRATRVSIDRRRQAVSPAGELTEERVHHPAGLGHPGGPVRGGRGGGAHRHRAAARPPHPRLRGQLRGGSRGAAMTATLRVCALYPELMNIYADRGNIAVLRARCEWRGPGLRAGLVHRRTSRSTAPPTTSSTSAAGRTATRSRWPRTCSAPSATPCTPRPTAAPPCWRCAAGTSCWATATSWASASYPGWGWWTCTRCARRASA